MSSLDDFEKMADSLQYRKDYVKGLESEVERQKEIISNWETVHEELHVSYQELAADNLALRQKADNWDKLEPAKKLLALSEGKQADITWMYKQEIEALKAERDALQSENARLREEITLFLSTNVRSPRTAFERLAKAALSIKPDEIKAKYDGARPHDVRGWKPEDDGHG